jgi:hypothetical protein
MTSTFPHKQISPLTQLKEQIFGNPERSLEQAYQAALKIKSIEDNYFNSNRIPIESADNNPHFPSFLQADIRENLNLLKRRAKEFNTTSAAVGKLGSNHLEKLIFVEGVLAKYTLEPHSSSALVPMSMNGNLSQAGSQSYLPTVKVVEVESVVQSKEELTGSTKKISDRHQPKPESPGNAKSILNKTGVLPRSLGKTINKIKKDFDPQAEKEVVSEFRRSRKVTVVAVRLLSLLIIIPLLTQQVSKHLLIAPIVEQVRGGEATVVALDELNSEWKEEALHELQAYEEELKMAHMIEGVPPIAPEVREEKVQAKANEIAEEFHHKSNNAIANVFADGLGLIAFAAVLFFKRKDINVLKSFIDNLVYGLSDSAKAFGIILFTDIFVGFHSPHGWEVLLEGASNHLGIAPSHSAISLFIATVPVIMDTLFKYWIFRYLSRMSPSTVATLKDMNE